MNAPFILKRKKGEVASSNLAESTVFYIALSSIKYVSHVRLFLQAFSSRREHGFTAECFILRFNCPNFIRNVFTK